MLAPVTLANIPRHMSDTAARDYLRDVSSGITTSYPEDCLAHACRIAELLLADGHAPWIGSIRDLQGDYHHPLIPQRLLGHGAPTWNVHYVCCDDGDAYDPLIGEPVPVGELAQRVFGRELAMAEAVSAATVRELASAQALRAHVHSLRWRR